MTREELADEVYNALYENASHKCARAATDKLMKKIDEYAESCTIDARLEVMKNFGAI